MKQTLAALAAGIAFGAGLALSGMSDPLKVLAFLTLGPGWDPSLLLVMGSAVLTTATGYALVNRRAKPLLDRAFHPPLKTAVDARLMAGAVLFGCGWGVSGFCPGPGIVAALTLDPRGWIFVSALIAGMLLFELLPDANGPAPADKAAAGG
jgi:uncharacterized membrane protein YedE/YeeE